MGMVTAVGSTWSMAWSSTLLLSEYLRMIASAGVFGVGGDDKIVFSCREYAYSIVRAASLIFLPK